MTIFELFTFLRRHVLVALAIVVFTAGSAGTVAHLLPTTATSTQLYAVSIASTPTTNAFDLTKIADDFAKTVAGWTQSPSFGDRVSDVAGLPVEVSGATQATQNFLLHGSYTDPADAMLVMDAIAATLQEYVDNYNSRSGYEFAVSEQGRTSGTSGHNVVLAGVAGTVGGTALVMAVALLFAYTGGRVVSVSQAEHLAGRSAAVVASRGTGDRTAFLRRVAKDADVIVGLDADVKELKLGSHTLVLPTDAEKIQKNKKVLLLVTLDTTRDETLREARRAMPDAELAIVAHLH